VGFLARAKKRPIPSGIELDTKNCRIDNFFWGSLVDRTIRQRMLNLWSDENKIDAYNCQKAEKVCGLLHPGFYQKKGIKNPTGGGCGGFFAPDAGKTI
jgi:hypothetical protein